MGDPSYFLNPTNNELGIQQQRCFQISIPAAKRSTGGIAIFAPEFPLEVDPDRRGPVIVMVRHTFRWTDRLIDGQTDRQSDKDRQMDEDRQTEDRWTRTDRQMGRQTDRVTQTDTDRQSDKDRQTDGQGPVIVILFAEETFEYVPEAVVTSGLGWMVLSFRASFPVNNGCCSSFLLKKTNKTTTLHTFAVTQKRLQVLH